MNPTELINPRCKITGTRPVVRSTRHIFLDLPKLAGGLQAYIDGASKDGGWSSNCLQVGVRGGQRALGRGEVGRCSLGAAASWIPAAARRRFTDGSTTRLPCVCLPGDQRVDA
jgi:hypothetical protein